MDGLQGFVTQEINLLRRNPVLCRRGTGQFGMPGVAIDADAFIENSLADLGRSAGGRIWAAALIGAARIEIEADEVVGRLGFQDDRIDARLKRARIPRTERLVNCFAANAISIEF